MIEVSHDLAQIDVVRVHAWLSKSYWAQGRTLEVVRRSMELSLNFGAFVETELVGYARVVTDRATFAWLCDVVVDERARGKGVGKALVQAVTTHVDLREIKRIVLATRDAHGLYAQYGFVQLPNADNWMVRPGQAHR